MQNSELKDNLKENILEKIKKDEVKMTSKQFFILKWITLFIVSLFFLTLGFYILAYVIFLFVDNGLIYMPLFSESGIMNFIIEIPWTLVLLGLFSIFLFSITSKTFYKIYRKPFLAFFFSILMIILLSQVILIVSGSLKYIKEEAYKENIHLVPDKFLDFRDSQTGTLLVGYVVGTSTNSIIIRDRRNNLVEVFTENIESEENFNLNSLQIGQLLDIYGQNVFGKFFAESIEIPE